MTVKVYSFAKSKPQVCFFLKILSNYYYYYYYYYLWSVGFHILGLEHASTGIYMCIYIIKFGTKYDVNLLLCYTNVGQMSTIVECS